MIPFHAIRFLTHGAGALGIILLAALAAGCNGGPEAQVELPADYGARVNPDGQVVVLVIDRSLSMTQKDPHNFNIAGAQIALSVMDDEDNAAVATFAAEGDIVQATRALESAQGRIEFRDKLESIKITGKRTDFSKGLGAAKALLEPLKGKARAFTVVFLTDGEHSVPDTRDDIPPLIQAFAENEWKIFTIDLAARTAKTELLRDMASKTRGAYFKIEKAEDLPRAFIEIFSDIKDFWEYGSKGPVRVQPPMKKLMYLLIRGVAGGHFTGIRRNGDVVSLDAENLYHYPDRKTASRSRRYWFEIAALSKPEAGTYSYTTAKTPEVWTLATFPVSLTLLENAPRKSYREDEAVELGIRADCRSQEVADMVRKAAFVRAFITSAAGEEEPREVVLSHAPAEEGGDPLSLVFRGKTYIQLSQKGEAEDFTARIRFAIRDEEGGQWFAGKLATFRVEPGLPKVLMVDPPQAMFGRTWIDQGGLSASITASTEIESGAVQVTAETESEGLAVTPASASLTPGATARFTLSVDPKAHFPPGGDFQEKIRLKATGPDGRSMDLDVPVLFGVFAFEGPETVKTPTAPPGYQIAHAFEFTVTPAVRPVEVRCEKVSGSGRDVRVMIRHEEIETVAPPADGNGEDGEETGAEGAEESGEEDGGEDAETSGQEEGEEGAAEKEPPPPPEPASFRVRIDIPTQRGLPEGTYNGVIEVAGTGEPPLVREIPLEVNMAVPEPEVKIEPEAIEVTAEETGWREVPVELSLASTFAVDFAMQAQNLDLEAASGKKGRVSKTFDVRLVPEEGWRGDRLEHGKRYRFLYRVYVSPNLHRGVYRGGLVMVLSGAAKSSKIRVPVVLTVE